MNRIENEKQKNIDFAEKNGISQVEMENIFQDIYNKMPADMDENKKLIRSLRKTRGTLKRTIQGGKRINGFVFMRFQNHDWNKRAYDEAKSFAEVNGKEKAIQAGYMNENGDYLHHKGKYNIGQVINPQDIYGNAIGIFEDEKGEVTPHELSIGRYVINKKVVPICKEATFNVKITGKKSQLNNNDIFYFNNAVVTDNQDAFDDETIDIYLGYVKKFFGDIVFDNFVDALQYLESTNFDRNSFAVIESSCLGARVSENPKSNIPITFETDEDDIQVWLSPLEYEGLNLYDGAYGYLFFNAYKKADGTFNYHCGGFLPIEEF